MFVSAYQYQSQCLPLSKVTVKEEMDREKEGKEEGQERGKMFECTFHRETLLFSRQQLLRLHEKRKGQNMEAEPHT